MTRPTHGDRETAADDHWAEYGRGRAPQSGLPWAAKGNPHARPPERAGQYRDSRGEWLLIAAMASGHIERAAAKIERDGLGGARADELADMRADLAEREVLGDRHDPAL